MNAAVVQGLSAGPARRSGSLSGLFGRGRLARWRRLVLRRALAVLLATGAVLTTVSLTRPPPAAPEVPVVVAARAVAAGATLTAADVGSGGLAEAARPPGALGSVDAAVGRQVVGALLPGEVVTTTRLVPRDPGDPLPAGLVSAHLLVDDPAALDLVTPGARVTIYPGDGGPALTREGLVLAVDARTTAPTYAVGLAEVTPGRGLVVAIPPDLADRIFAGQRPAGGPPVVAVTAPARRSTSE